MKLAIGRPLRYRGGMVRLLAALLLLPVAAHGLESAPVTTTHSTATLLTEADSFRPGHPLRLGLRLKMQPGWHTYWLNPGDAGAPPTLDIAGAQAGPIAYPTPARSTDAGFTSYVYTGEVLLPVTVTAPSGAGPWHVQAHATWLICQQVCVPEEASLALDLPAGSGAQGADAATSPRPMRRPPCVAVCVAHRLGRHVAPGGARDRAKQRLFVPR